MQTLRQDIFVSIFSSEEISSEQRGKVLLIIYNQSKLIPKVFIKKSELLEL